jgi:hypothetical protein
VVEIHHISREEERFDQLHQTPRGSAHRVARGSLQVETHVTAGNLAVEHSPSPELACHAAVSRQDHHLVSQPWRPMSRGGCRGGQDPITVEPGLILRVQGGTEARCHREALQRIVTPTHRNRSLEPLFTSGRVHDPDRRRQRAGGPDRNRGEALEDPPVPRVEVERLTADLPVHTEQRGMLGGGHPDAEEPALGTTGATDASPSVPTGHATTQPVAPRSARERTKRLMSKDVTVRPARRGISPIHYVNTFVLTPGAGRRILVLVTTKTSQLQIRVSPSQKAALKRRAAEAGLSVSAYVLGQALPGGDEGLVTRVRALARKPGIHEALEDLGAYLDRLGVDEFGVAVEDVDLSGLSALQANGVAAVVEREAWSRGLEPPEWTEELAPLERPHFAWNLRSLRPHLMRITPPAFKRRNLYIPAPGDPRR